MSLTTCPKCGEAVVEGDKFCESCGQPLTTEVAPTATASGASTPATSIPPPTTAPPPPLPASSSPPPVTVGKGVPAKPLLFIGGLVLLAALIGVWAQRRAGPTGASNKSTAQSGKLSTPSGETGPVVTSTTAPTGPTNGATPDNAPFLARGVQLFTHNFQTPKSIFTPLFGSNMMTAANAGGEGRLDGLSPGILPAMLGKFMLNDFVVECDMRAGSVPPGAGYGFIIRSADVQDGAISTYYAILISPNENVVGMSCWSNGSWVMNVPRQLPPGILQSGKTQRLAVSALGTEFTVYLDDQFVASFSDATLSEGRLGLCLAGANGTSTVYFDNFTIYMPP